jgi:acyl carrier protein
LAAFTSARPLFFLGVRLNLTNFGEIPLAGLLQELYRKKHLTHSANFVDFTAGSLMDREAIEKRVKEIVVKQLNVNMEQVTPESSFYEDLGADSLDLVELVMAFESEFSNEVAGEIPEADADKLRTIKDVVDYIHSKAN